MSELTPPDFDRCQAEKPNGNTFMTLGGRPGLVRCREKPLYIVTEKEPGSDGQRGSMSLCESCHDVAIDQLGDVFDTEHITNPRP